MKNSRYIIPLLLLSVLLMTGCNGSKESSEASRGPELYSPQYASGYTISQLSPASQSTIIDIVNPWQGAEDVVRPLLIVRGGEDVPDNFDGQVINGDAKRIVAMSSTHVALLDAVGAVDRVVGVSGLRYIANPKIRAKGDSIVDVGPEGNVDYEKLAALRPDIVLLYSVSGISPMENKLRELGIPFMYVGDYLEESPVGKAEWMVPLAELCGMRERGVKRFDKIPPAYDALKTVAEQVASRPKVMLNTPYSGSWYFPSSRSYLCRLIKDAGADPVYDEDTGTESRPIDMEQAYLLASKSDFWLNPGVAQSIAEVRAMAPRLAGLPLMAQGKIYNNNRRATLAGGNDFYESAIAEPEVVLRDLINIFHPGLLPDSQMVYYQDLK